MRTPTEPTWRTAVPIRSGEALLELPLRFSEPVLNREIAVQDLTGKRLLQMIHRLERIGGSNLELAFFPEAKLQATANELLAVGTEIGRFFSDFATYRSAIDELRQARADVGDLVRGLLLAEVARFENRVQRTFDGEEARGPARRRRLDAFRQELARSLGLVNTELKKIFAHLMARDPRNLYRVRGARSERAILFRQFRRDVETTEELYAAVRRLDTYVRGAIIATDLLKMTAARIERERSVSSLFEADYSLFLNALFDEIAERLIPELEEIQTLDGIWYDDYESLLKKSKMIARLTTAFKAAYLERAELRDEAFRCAAAAGYDPERGGRAGAVLAVFDHFGFAEMAARIRSIDQILVDLEGMLLQWEKGITMRTFADSRWREEDPDERMRRSSVVFAP